jgi:hypothetical protein
MNAPDCCLTLVVPAALEEDLVDQMLEHPQWVSGFVIGRAEGAGQNVPLSGVNERVRGRSARVQLQVVLARDDARALVGALKAAFPIPEIAYWITPVIEFGRFA